MGFSPESQGVGIELMPIVQEQLAQGKTVSRLPFRGCSMLPMLRQGKDAVDLAPLPSRLKKYDLPVYRYPSGKVVMHRVVGVKDDHYICLGDNTYRYEKIRPEWMIGLVTAFYREKKRILVDTVSYRIYSRIWVTIYPLRKGWRAVKQMLRRLIR